MKEFPFECGSSEERSQVECIHWLPKCTPEDRARIRNGISVRIDQTRLLKKERRNGALSARVVFSFSIIFRGRDNVS